MHGAVYNHQADKTQRGKMKTQKLAAQLAEWEKQGLITAEQSGGIIAYENSRHTVPWVIYSFIMLGVTVVAVGVISLVAANWSTIPAWLKLTADFAILTGPAAFLCRFGDGANRPFLTPLRLFSSCSALPPSAS